MWKETARTWEDSSILWWKHGVAVSGTGRDRHGRKLAAALETVESDPVLILIQAPQQSSDRFLQWLEAVPGAREKVQDEHVRIVGVKLEQEVRVSARKGKCRKLYWSQTWDRIKLSHQATGGVVDQEWLFSFSFSLGVDAQKKVVRETAVQAELQDYLSPTVEGATMWKEVNRSQLPTLIPWKCKKVKVLALCVFSSMGWVQRMMTTNELLDTYDVSAADWRLMRKPTQGESEAETIPLSFTQQVPVRVLERILGWLREKGNGDVESDEEGEGGLGRTQTGNNYRAEATQAAWRGAAQLKKEVLARGGCLVDAAEDTKATTDGYRQSKNDDAITHVREWNLRVCRGLDGCIYQAGVHDKALDALRLLLLIRYRSWRGPLWTSFRRYMETEHGQDWAQRAHRWRTSRCPRTQKVVDLLADFEVGMDVVKLATGASFWEWDNGSTLFFWRWPVEYRRAMRDGFEVCFRESELPTYWGKQSWPQEPKARDQLKEKVLKVIKKGYIKKGQVQSLTGFFAVPKGTEDIRVVYDATKSGLNAAIWSPNFYLPTATTVLNNSDDTTYYGDIDLGEMFLNYFLDPQLRSRAGLDVTELAAELGERLEPGRRLYMRWERALMGVWSSPFNCVRAYLISEDIVRGDR